MADFLLFWVLNFPNEAVLHGVSLIRNIEFWGKSGGRIANQPDK